MSVITDVPCSYGHTGPAVIVVDAHCDTCGTRFRWMDSHGEGHFDLPVRIPVECLALTDITCAHCGGRVLMATEASR